MKNRAREFLNMNFEIGNKMINQRRRNYSKGESVMQPDIIYRMVWECGKCGYLHYDKKTPGVCPVCASPRNLLKLRAANC